MDGHPQVRRIKAYAENVCAFFVCGVNVEGIDEGPGGTLGSKNLLEI